jgi:predicted RNA-binding protein with PIN domain
MGFLIDGHNLIAKIPGMSLSAIDDERDLIDLLQNFYRMHRKAIEVYFDGAAPGNSGKRRFGVITAYFVRQGSTADAALVQRMQVLRRQAKNWIVVSSDRRVQCEARAMGYLVLGSASFAGDLQTASMENSTGTLMGKKGDANGGELDEWMRLFGVKDDE